MKKASFFDRWRPLGKETPHGRVGRVVIIVHHRRAQVMGNGHRIHNPHVKPLIQSQTRPNEVITPAHGTGLVERQKGLKRAAVKGKQRPYLHETGTPSGNAVQPFNEGMVDITVMGACRLRDGEIIPLNQGKIIIHEALGQHDIIIDHQQIFVGGQIDVCQEPVEENKLWHRFFLMPGRLASANEDRARLFPRRPSADPPPNHGSFATPPGYSGA